MATVLSRVARSLRYRLGMKVVAPGLEDGTDDGVRSYYNSRLSECSFLQDPNHYERPRVEWMLPRIKGGSVLEIGCADGTVTAMLAPRVDRVVALDVCEAAIQRVRERRLPNVEAVSGLVERFETAETFDWIVMSEVLEHLRDPTAAISRALRLLRPSGALLLSTPSGRWDNDAIEHLHEFDFGSWCSMIVAAGAPDFRAFEIHDREGKPRWLGAEVLPRTSAERAVP